MFSLFCLTFIFIVLYSFLCIIFYPCSFQILDFVAEQLKITQLLLICNSIFWHFRILTQVMNFIGEFYVIASTKFLHPFKTYLDIRHCIQIKVKIICSFTTAYGLSWLTMESLKTPCTLRWTGRIIKLKYVFF